MKTTDEIHSQIGQSLVCRVISTNYYELWFPRFECDFTGCDQLNYSKLSYSKHVFLHSANPPNCLRHAPLVSIKLSILPCDLGGHVPQVEVVGDHCIVSNQRVRLKLQGFFRN